MSPSPFSAARRARAGFSLLEIIVAISIIAILVGVVGFRSGSAVQRGQASRLVQLVKNVEKAAVTHYSDTGRYAEELEVTQAASRRDLTSPQTYTGWAGPYLERPFATDDTNPFGLTRLYATLDAGSWVPGFDSDGDGTPDLTGNGNMIVFWDVPEEVAQSIDKAFDGGIPGDWFTTGRVVYQAGSRRTLVYVFK
ncbi:MAG: prepilin-type N-terminal cleavage/methylation domain-containing protein [Planctomycetota bacterium]